MFVDVLVAKGDLAVGFAVSKRHGSAVERNRIRRRLRAAVGVVIGEVDQATGIHLVIAKNDVETVSWDRLVKDVRASIGERNDSRGC